MSFLPDRAQRLHQVLTDPRLGDCDPAGSTLVLDPTMAELKTEVKAAVTRAAGTKATLVLAFIGHAEINTNKASAPLFLLPKDGDPRDLDDDSAYEIGRRLGNMSLGSLDGLILILDVCHAGLGVTDVIKNGLDLKDQVRLELLAGTYDREARNGCFSQSLISLMESGQPDLSVDYLDIRHAANYGNDTCHAVQDPPIYIGSGMGQNTSDPGLWITRNIASPNFWPLSGTAEGALAVTLTQSFQITHDLERVMRALAEQRLVVIQGDGGSGKSALVAALARPELVPELSKQYLSAVAFTALSPTLAALAESIGKQLEHRAGFDDAVTVYNNGFTPQDLDRQPALERLVFGPLSRMKVPLGNRIRLAIDGIDQLEPSVRNELISTLVNTSLDDRLERLSILLNTRGEGTEKLSEDPIILVRPGTDEIAEYLAAQGLPTSLAADITAHSSTWLEARLLTDVMSTIGNESVKDAVTLSDLYQRLFSSITGEDTTETKTTLAVLAAAGSGPVMPIRVAVEACSRLGGAADEARFRDTLKTLGGLATRADPGTSDEHVGLFHDTLVQQVHQQDRWPVATLQAHQTILETLETMSDPASSAYRRRHAAEHLWALERHKEALSLVFAGLGHRAADNRDLLQTWLNRAKDTLPPDNIDLLRLIGNLATWTGRSGDATGAINQFRELLEARLRVLGPDHPNTLITRNNLASWTGESGDTAGAINQFRELLEARLRVLGPAHPNTLITRNNLASWTGESGDTTGAITQSRELLEAQLRVLGPDHPDTLTTRNNLASWTGESGDTTGAITQFRELLEAQLRVLGPDHPDTLTTRNNLASWTGESGDTTGAITQFRELLEAQLRVLGPDHPSTLTTRNNLAFWAGRSGDTAGAINQFRELLEAHSRVLGPDHPNTLITRNNLASWTGESGDNAGAITQFRELLEAQLRVLGPDHPDTLTTRNNLASWTGESGGNAGTITQFRELLETQLRVLGPDHPNTLITRNNLASCTRKSGDNAGAITQFRELLEAQLRVLGPNHPNTLATRINLAFLVRDSGDTAGLNP
ncbi:tetratricopeptide repeat protein [Arthrobacter sp. CAN_C5]|uniref:tetratricopeptide repeat protein n=1 Tax=Arthrobacter sp. CAN_C5 TaxID=2760706 RepID=UPI001AE9DD31|nr:tetratricopeptide repeat protein [Arthrobacter sp. CAN_C5]MBP2215970.1 hypothetical protein [Arthrobacter sp. CAN_C5]